MRELRHDPLAYIERVGPADKGYTLEALANGGENTALRLCIGPVQGPLPLRTLGYIGSAAYIQKEYFPKATLQVIVAIHTAARINEFYDGRLIAEQLQRRTDFLPEQSLIRQECGKLWTDKSTKPWPRIDPGRIVATMRGTDTAERLSSKASKRTGDYVPYLAAHMMVHDIVDTIEPLDYWRIVEESPIEGIISIGALSERTFYSARMHCRNTWHGIPGQVENTGQLFTKHVLPPYIRSRPISDQAYFDPTLAEYRKLDYALTEDPIALRSNSVLRDLHHTRDLLRYDGLASI